MVFTRLFSSYLLALSCFCHFLCCGIPFTLSIISLFTNIGIPSLLFLNFSIEKFEPIFLIFSTLIFLFLILSEIHNKRINCTNSDRCEDVTCDSKQKKIKFNLYFSATLYLFNLVIFTLERY